MFACRRLVAAVNKRATLDYNKLYQLKIVLGGVRIVPQVWSVAAHKLGYQSNQDVDELLTYMKPSCLDVWLQKVRSRFNGYMFRRVLDRNPPQGADAE